MYKIFIKLLVRILYESPWPFLVSTASLFLILGAVMFFPLYFFFFLVLVIIYFYYRIRKRIIYLKVILFLILNTCMMSWNGMGSKSSDAIRNTVLIGTGIGGYSGSLLNTRMYSLKSTKEHLYGNVYIDPTNYNEVSLRLLRKLSLAYQNQDKAKIYSVWKTIYENPQGSLTENYGKIHNVVNMMNNYYNTKVDIQNISTEKGYIEHYNLVLSPKTLNNITPDQYNSLTESITMEIVNNKNQMIQYHRNDDNQLEIPNLGFQPNNDCIFKLRLVEKDGMFSFGYVDCKKTDEISFKLKLQQFREKGIILEHDSKAEFGCNLYLIASDKKAIILNPVERQTVLDFIDKVAKENPQIFKNYQNSPELLEFKNTGKLNLLTNSSYPFPKVITNHDCRKLLRYSDNKDYKEIIREMEQKKTGRIFDINLEQNDN